MGVYRQHDTRVKDVPIKVKLRLRDTRKYIYRKNSRDTENSWERTDCIVAIKIKENRKMLYMNHRFIIDVKNNVKKSLGREFQGHLMSVNLFMFDRYCNKTMAA